MVVKNYGRLFLIKCSYTFYIKSIRTILKILFYFLFQILRKLQKYMMSQNFGYKKNVK